MTAAPIAVPTIACSEIGVSSTRSGPNRSYRPSVSLECATGGADVLAEQEDVLVFLERVAHCAVERLSVGDRGHARTCSSRDSAAGSGHLFARSSASTTVPLGLGAEPVERD